MNQFDQQLRGNGPTRAVPFTSIENMARVDEVAEYAHVGEFRADLFKTYTVEEMRQAVAQISAGMLSLVTVREKSQAGRERVGHETDGFDGTEVERFSLIKKLIRGADAVDIELQAEISDDVICLANDEGKSTIVSYHNFLMTPTWGEMDDILGLAEESRADYIKFALEIATQEEFERVAQFLLDNNQHNLIIVGMGKFGPRSRVAYPTLRSKMTYDSMGEKSPVKGMLDYRVHADIDESIF